LIFVKARAGVERMIGGAMSTSRTRPWVSAAAKWRRALAVVLMLLIGFAPVAKAACDLEALAAHLGDAAARLAAPLPPDDDGACCDHEPGAFVLQAKTPLADATLVPSVADVPLGAASHALAARPARPGSIRRAYSHAPPEPVFRRVPRLLI
jgi:hypothetical protein